MRALLGKAMYRYRETALLWRAHGLNRLVRHRQSPRNPSNLSYTGAIKEKQSKAFLVLNKERLALEVIQVPRFY